MRARLDHSKTAKWLVPIVLVVGAGLSLPVWWPMANTWLASSGWMRSGSEIVVAEPDTHDHDHDHGHENPFEKRSGRPPLPSIELSTQAIANLGLTNEYLRPVSLGTYRRTIKIPAVIVSKPGRSQIIVSSPLSGVIKHVHAVTGEAVSPGHLLFEVRLTYEDLVETQTQFLQSITELAVENREIARLEQATQSGAVSGKSLLDRRYAKDKLEAHIRSQREALRLHGLSERQIEDIATGGKLLGDLQIVAPDVDTHSEKEELRLSGQPFTPVSFVATQSSPSLAQFPSMQPALNSGLNSAQHAHPEDQPSSGKPLVIGQLQASKGQAVTAGAQLCTLSDYSQLFIEGQAFEQDIDAIALLNQRGWSVTANFPGEGTAVQVANLQVAFVDHAVNANSRTLSVFVELPNQILNDTTNAEGQRFVSWKYRVGQRLELEVPVEEWTDQLILPADAVVKDGVEWFVFRGQGLMFYRVPVHVMHRDPTSVVIANDGSIKPGNKLALRSAHQLQMALKSKASGVADPHAGHSH
ncbi:MAG: efflux RND transporter periplasmic adaptor subunit [Pirellulaceae bacterium]|nr:efflux RND transporter periplasmic adaptor subunit [Pirellulaceae bacterium]